MIISKEKKCFLEEKAQGRSKRLLRRCRSWVNKLTPSKGSKQLFGIYIFTSLFTNQYTNGDIFPLGIGDSVHFIEHSSLYMAATV